MGGEGVLGRPKFWETFGIGTHPTPHPAPFMYDSMYVSMFLCFYVSMSSGEGVARESELSEVSELSNQIKRAMQHKDTSFPAWDQVYWVHWVLSSFG